LEYTPWRFCPLDEILILCLLVGTGKIFTGRFFGVCNLKEEGENLLNPFKFVFSERVLDKIARYL
jgi:hypothetical protein